MFITKKKDKEVYLECLSCPDLVDEAMQKILNLDDDLVNEEALSILEKKGSFGDVFYQTSYLMYHYKYIAKIIKQKHKKQLRALFDLAHTPQEVLPLLEESCELARSVVEFIFYENPQWIDDLVRELNRLCEKKTPRYHFYDGLRREVLLEEINETIDNEVYQKDLIKELKSLFDINLKDLALPSCLPC